MRLPKRPPKLGTLLGQLLPSCGNVLLEPTQEVRNLVAAANNEGWNWEECGYRAHQVKLTAEQFWVVVKLSRGLDRRTVELLDVKGKPFTYRLPPAAHRILHLIDTSLGGTIGSKFPQVTTEDEQKTYLLTSLREEAISSSLIEGAVATREEAKEMIRSNRRPRTHGEKMILNNYLTIRYLNERRGDPLTPALLNEVQKRLTDETLSRPEAAGRFRRDEEAVTVWDDEDQQDLHVPPPANELAVRMDRLCEFGNRADGVVGNGEFIHPAIRAILLHFWLAYDHPFVDGNGRTARALFYWAMLRQGYWLTEYISISRVIAGQAKQYARAYLNTEQDENDLTYFILYHLKVIELSLLEFQKYLARKQEEQSRTILVQSRLLNSRQRSLIVRALKDPTARFTYESHAASHGVVLATGRSDVLHLEHLGLLVGNRVGRRYEFVPARDIEARLKMLSR